MNTTGLCSLWIFVEEEVVGELVGGLYDLVIAQQAEVVACHPLFDVEGVHEVAVDIGGGEHAAAGESGAGDALQLLQFAFFELVFALLALEDVATGFFAPAKLQGWDLQGGSRRAL